MPSSTPTFRIFVSSTFDDLKAERDALQHDVFPKMRKLCESLGARFQAIDLRWGVRNEATLDQRTMDICLREIERCKATGIKPNFIVLLGDRYGWRPVPSRIPASELDPTTIVGDWYRLDENAVPPEYVLQPRTGIFTSPDIWSVVEDVLHSRLEAAARAAGIKGRPLSKYVDSATHQEVLAGLAGSEDDQQHVFGFFREKSEETDARLEKVKVLIRNRTEFPRGNLTKLCAEVFKQLAHLIEIETKRLQSDIGPGEHDTFAGERTSVFVGRTAELTGIADYLNRQDTRPLVVYGAPGSGKSALMAKASEQSVSQMRVFRRFSGSSASVSDSHSLLTSLCQELAPTENTPLEFTQLERAFQNRLQQAGRRTNVALFIDGLDQLPPDDPAHAYFWIPNELPRRVKIVFSTTAAHETLPFGASLVMSPMAPEEAMAALNAWLAHTDRTLQPRQRDLVIGKFSQSGLPLYLKLAAEESRLWPSYAEDGCCLLGKGISGIVDTLFTRLSGAEHGKVLVSHALGCLSAAHSGLTDDEMLEILTEDDAVWKDFEAHRRHDVSERRLPVVVWSRLHYDLAPYLADRAAPGGTVITFFHRQLALQARLNQNERHNSLAQFFGRRPTWLDSKRRLPNSRKAVELVHQQLTGGDTQAAVETVMNMDFLSAKCASHLLMDLLDEYRRIIALLAPETEEGGDSTAASEEIRYNTELLRYAQECAVTRKGNLPFPAGPLPPESVLSFSGERPNKSGSADRNSGSNDQQRVSLFYRFVATEIAALSAHSAQPGFFAQHAWNSSGSLEIKDAAAVFLESFTEPVIMVRSTTPGTRNTQTGLLMTLQSHEDEAKSVWISADGKRFMTGGGDRRVNIWETHSGRLLESHKPVESSYPGGIYSRTDNIVVSASGMTAVAWGGIGGVGAHAFVYHLDRKQIDVIGCDTSRPSSGGDFFRACDISVDGSIAVTSAVFDGRSEIGVWSITEKPQLMRSMSFDQNVTDVVVNADGTQVLLSGDQRVEVWALTEPCCRIRLLNRPGSSWVGQAAASASFDRFLLTSHTSHPKDELLCWDLSSDSCNVLDAAVERQSSVQCVRMTPDGRSGVIMMSRVGLVICDLQTSRVIGFVRVPEGYGRVAISATGRFAVTAAGPICVWDLLGAVEPAIETSAPVNQVLVEPARGLAFVAAGTQSRALDLKRAEERWKNDLDWYDDQLVLASKGRYLISRGWLAGLLINDVASWTTVGAIQAWDNERRCAIFKIEAMDAKPYGLFVVVGGSIPEEGDSIGKRALWRLDLAKMRFELLHQGALGSFRTLLMLPSAKHAIAAASHFRKTGEQTEVVFLNIGEGSVRTLESQSDCVTSLALTPDGYYAIGGSMEGTITIWNLMTGRIMRQHRIWERAASFVAVTFDGRRVVASSTEGSLIGLDLRSGLSAILIAAEDRNPQLADFEQKGIGIDQHPYRSMAMSLDGRFICSGRFGRDLWIANLAGDSREPIVCSFPAPLSAIALAGEDLIVGDSTGGVRFLQMRDFPSGPIRLTTDRNHNIITCTACGASVKVTAEIRETLDRYQESINDTAGAIGYLCLPDDAWNDGNLASNCSGCGRQIAFNPFYRVNPGRG